MNSFSRAALKSYTNVNKDIAVDSADNHELVKMLFSGAVDAICQAEGCFKSGDLVVRGESITKAQTILFGLRSTLDHVKGGELARNLDSLYEYCSRQLTKAHVSNELEPVQEARSLLAQIREAWQIMPLNPAPPAQ